MRFYLIAGEASGDLHGGNLVRAMKSLRSDVDIRAWGGEQMENAGATIVKHYRDLAFMGFLEVLLNLRTILRNFDFCKKDIIGYAPDALILIDYPGFNLRMAKWAKQRGLKVIYYISPQIWAWNTKRVHEIKRNVDEMLVILPFEKAFYAEYGMDVHFVGHPLLDAIGKVPKWEDRDGSIALLPGSRKQELDRLLPLMLQVADAFPEMQFLLAAAPAVDYSVYEKRIKERGNVQIVYGNSYSVLRRASYALVKSGTSTLETALHHVPQVVCYRGSPISYQIAKRVVQVKYISLVNLILNRPLVKELIQEDCTATAMIAELELLMESSAKQRIMEGYQELSAVLGNAGASRRAAEAVLKKIS